MTGGGGGGGQNTTVQKADPWSGQQAPLLYGFSEARKQYDSNTPKYFPDSTVAPLSETTQQAMALQSQRALKGNPLQTQGNSYLGDVLGGSYLNSNPYLDANFRAGAQNIAKNYYDTIGGINSGLSGAGRYGSGMQAFMTGRANDTLANSLGNLYAQTYYNNYNAERANQQNALGYVPTMVNQDYIDLSKLSDVGALQDKQQQSLIDAAVNKWNYEQNLPANKLGQYMGLIQGNYGGSQSTQTPLSGTSLIGSLLGAGALGLGAYGALSR